MALGQPQSQFISKVLFYSYSVRELTKNRFSDSYFYSRTHFGSIKFWLHNKVMAETFCCDKWHRRVWATSTVRWPHRDNETPNRFGRFANTNETDGLKEVRKKMVNAMQLRKQNCINSFVVHAQTHDAKLNSRTKSLQQNTCTHRHALALAHRSHSISNLLHKIVKMNGNTTESKNANLSKCESNGSELPVILSWNSVDRKHERE